MAAMAGALGVKLEKKGFYSIGKGELFVEHIFLSVRIVNVATILFLTGLACYVAFA
jgi:cobalamin biosynthesis protein CobD/CbiB